MGKNKSSVIRRSMEAKLEKLNNNIIILNVLLEKYL